MTDQINLYSIMTDKGFEQVFKENYRGLCIYAQNYIQELAVAEDIVHDVFVNMWHKRDSIHEERSVKSYLYRSVHNRCLNYIRDNKKFATNSEDILDSATIQISEDNEQQYAAAELEGKIMNIISSLPLRCGEVFKLSRFEELKYSEIAERLNISIKTVENQISKALKILRKQLSDYDILLFLIIFFHIQIGEGIFTGVL